MISIAALVLGSFILGAFPTGYLVGRLCGKDVRNWGSGSTGGTNVLRSCGRVPALLTVAGDVLKAMAAVWLSILLLGTGWGKVLAGTLAILGHTYSPFLSWKGGRGVATAVAALGVLCFPCAAAVLIVGGLVLLLSRYASLASLTIGAVMPIFLLIYYLVFGGDSWWLAYGVLAGAIIWFNHRGNLQRLIRGTERRLGETANPAA